MDNIVLISTNQIADILCVNDKIRKGLAIMLQNYVKPRLTKAKPKANVWIWHKKVACTNGLGGEFGGITACVHVVTKKVNGLKLTENEYVY